MHSMKGFSGDPNDDWILEMDHGDMKWDSESGKRLWRLRMTSRLKHASNTVY